MPEPKRGRSKQLRLRSNVRWSNVHVDIHGEGNIQLLLHSPSLDARGNNRSIVETASSHAPIDLRILNDYSTIPKILIAKRGTLSARILVALYHEELGRAILEGVIEKDRVGPVGLTNKNSGNSEISAPTRIYPPGPKT